VRVPRDALLDAYAGVSEDGVYSSAIPNVSARFGVTVGGLTTGRVLIAAGAVDAAKIGVAIALRYGLARPQFGDKPIMEYLTHQRRLLPALAQSYALHLARGTLKDVIGRKRPEDAKTIHVLSSGLKAAATWGRVEVLQVRAYMGVHACRGAHTPKGALLRALRHLLQVAVVGGCGGR
jgi:acyl-CoA oxidase